MTYINNQNISVNVNIVKHTAEIKLHSPLKFAYVYRGRIHLQLRL